MVAYELTLSNETQRLQTRFDQKFRPSETRFATMTAEARKPGCLMCLDLDAGLRAWFL
jgi:hypothetical protein